MRFQRLDLAVGTCVVTASVAAVSLLYLKRRLKDERSQEREQWQWSLVQKATVDLRARGLEVLTLEAEEEAVALATSAMSGSSTAEPFPAFEWMYGPELASKWDHPLRVQAVRNSMLKCFRNNVINGGVVVGLRSNGRLVAVAFTCPFIAQDGSCGGFLEKPLGIDTWPLEDEAKYGQLPKVRALWFARGPGNLLGRLHETCAPFAHWYINVLAVDPRAQGQSYGKRVLEAVHALADGYKVPCYLDTCGERLRSLYEHMDYKVVLGRGYELNVVGDPDPIEDSDTHCIVRCYGMLRAN